MPKQKSPEQIADDEARTTAFGMFTDAEAYLLSARALRSHSSDDPFSTKVKHGKASKPVRFLYVQAIELYLKAFLRQHRLTVAELSGPKFGHKVGKLAAHAKILDLILDPEDHDVFAWIDSTNALIQARYSRTGPTTAMNPNHLDVTAEHLNEKVGAALRAAGHTTRPLSPL